MAAKSKSNLDADPCDQNQSEDKRAEYLDNIPTPVMVVDRDFNIIYMNPAGAQVRGKRPEEVLGSKCYDFFRTTHCKTEQCACRQAMVKDGTFVEETVVDPKGLGLPIRYTGFPIKDDRGNIIGAEEFVLDITNEITMIDQVTELATRAVEGDLSVRAEADRFDGNYRQIVSLLNGVLDAIVQPIREASDVMQKVAEGDMTVAMTGDYKGEYDAIKTAINTAVGNLLAILSQVSQNAGQLSSASAELSATATQMASGAEEQTAQTGEVATAVEEMTATIGEVARNAGVAADESKGAVGAATEGGDVVGQTIQGMNTIAATVTEAAHTISELGQRADEIGEIVGVVDDIADQTNLLALNAAIEAARAGEHGRGFAVVADEVRKLAEKTTTATKEVAKVIKAIQKETAQAVQAMEAGTREVENGTTLANQAGIALQKIVSGASRVTEMVIQIAAASEQQSAAAEQISRNVEGINAVSKQSAAGSAQSADAARQVSELAAQLQNGVAKFKLYQD